MSDLSLPLTPEAREDLRRLAELALPGLWRATTVFPGWRLVCTLGQDGEQRRHYVDRDSAELQPDSAAHDAAFIAACSPERILALLTDYDRLAGRLKELETPTIFWHKSNPECGYNYEQDLSDDIPVNDVAEIEVAHHLPNQWAAHVATEYSDDFEHVEESEIQLYATEAEAREAVAVVRPTITEPAPK